MGKIARKDHEGEVVMIAVDRVERAFEPPGRIERIETSAIGNEVRVGQNNKLH